MNASVNSSDPLPISHTERLWRDRAEYWCVEFTKKEAGEAAAVAKSKYLDRLCNWLTAIACVEFVALVCAGVWILGRL